MSDEEHQLDEVSLIMSNFLQNHWLISLVALASIFGSAVADFGNESWAWFQRSGSITVLLGALLTYRSIVRLGIQGVGGAEPTILMGKVTATREVNGRQMVDVSYDSQTMNIVNQARKDKTAGYWGAVWIILGTVIWGYGDLIGVLLRQ